ncbi:hypothetical protein [Halothiobacillus diazotrophicus]|uniref:hypothetical protein n=1 Tax=Halothiobacillus diazotrophicus TaxID=1860122 RepID=UPI0018D3D1AF|nr:hypothetical protein [Halothiobacillus diazotrophicus]
MEFPWGAPSFLGAEHQYGIQFVLGQFSQFWEELFRFGGSGPGGSVQHTIAIGDSKNFVVEHALFPWFNPFDAGIFPFAGAQAE